MTPAIRPANVPLGPLAVNAIGAVLLLIGAAGLFVPGIASAVPALGDPVAAWTLLATGALLDTWSGLAIVQRLRFKPR